MLRSKAKLLPFAPKIQAFPPPFAPKPTVCPKLVQVIPCIWKPLCATGNFTKSIWHIIQLQFYFMQIAIEKILHFLANTLHIFTVVIASICCGTATAQDSTYSSYLKLNNEKLSSGNNNSFLIFDEAFYDNQLFLVTESHGYAKPHEIDAQIFIQLNKKKGVRHYLAEMDYSQAYYLNKYLNTGNETFLSSIYEYWFSEVAQWGCKAGFEKWRTLYQYNTTLAKDKKIIVLGLDEAQDLNMNEKLIVELLATVKYKNGTHLMLDSLISFASINIGKDSTKAFKKFVKRVEADMKVNEKGYQKILKNQFFDVSFILRNIAEKRNREDRIFHNFNIFYKQFNLADKKLYGFWGRFHGMLDSINGGLSFSAMLKKSNSDLKDKIVTIPIFCVESASMLPTKFLPAMAQQKGKIFTKSDMVNDDSFVYTVDGIKTFRKFVGKNETVLFRLNGVSSPYHKGLNLVESNSQFDKTFNWRGNKSAATSSYFQYVIVVSNSDWAVPYGDNNEK